MPAQRITRTTYGKRANGRATRSAQLDDDDDPMVVPTKVTESKKPPSASRVGSALKGKEFDIPVVRTSGVRRPSTTVPRPPDASIRTPSKPAAISKASLRSSGSLSSPNDLEASDDEMEIAELVRMSAPPADTAKSIGKRKEQVTNEPSSPSRVKRQRLEAYVDVPSVSKSRVHTAQPVVTGKVSPAKPATAVPPQTVKRAVPVDAEQLSPRKKRLSMNPRSSARTPAPSTSPLSSPTTPSTPPISPTTPVRVVSTGPSIPEHLRSGPKRGLHASRGRTASHSRMSISPKQAVERKTTKDTPRPSTPPPRRTPFPSTPTPKPPKNLSALFDSLPRSPATPGTPPRTGVVRSMSKRSPMKASASQSGSEASSPLLPATPTKPFVSSSQTDNTPKQESQSSQPEATPPHRAASRTTSAASSAHKTYAKSRSFLMEVGSSGSHSQSLSQSQSQSLSMSQGNSQNITDMDVDAMMADLDAPSIPQSLGFDDFGMGEVTESYAEKAARWGIEDDRADAGLQDPADLRSISFQRSKGENRRFADEVGFLLEGLKAGQALAIRRSSALQFVEKMLDNDFIRKLRAVDGIGRSWDALRQAGAGDGDHVLDGTLFLYIALITKDARNAESLLSAMDDVVSVAVHGLETRIEDDTLAGARVPKGERGLMGTLKTLLAKAELDVEDAKPSTRHLISSSLKALASLTPTPLTLPILAPIIASLLQELRPFTRRLVAFADGKPLLPHEDDDDENGATSVDLVHADNCLQVLERFTLRGNNDDYSSEAMDIVREHVDELSEHLLSLCIGCRVLMGTDEKWAASARGCLISSLRVLVNLSSGEIRWCHAILSQPAALPGAIRLIVQSDQEAMKASAIGGRESAHDVLCLGLALLTNLVEQVPEARASVRETLYNVSCAEGPECTYSCHCSKRVSALRCLVGLYVRKTEEAERYAAESEEREGAESAFVAGHCSVLLSILALNNSANFKMIVKALPGKDKRDKVDRLLTAVRDFTDAQKVAKEAFSAKSRANEAEDTDEGDEEEPLRADHVNPVEVDWKADKTKTVVAQIIQMLEELRDAA